MHKGRVFTLIVFLVVICLAVGCKKRSPKGGVKSQPDAAHPPWTNSKPPPTSVKTVGEVVKELEWGNIVFQAPKSMRYKKTETIKLLLSHSASIQELRSQFEKTAEIESARIQISNRMEARLSGVGFQIETLVPEVQAVSSEGETEWKWYVTPADHGSQLLHLTLSAIIIVSDRDSPYVVRTFDRTIEVEISFVQRTSGFFSKNWKWLWVAILVPIVGYLWKRYHKKAKHEVA